MFQLLRLTSIRWIIILCLFTQPMQAGDTLLLFKEQSDQKDSTQHLTQDTSHQEASMVSKSQWMPGFIKETASYVSLKASALRNLLGESDDNEKLLLGFSKHAWHDAKDLEDNIEVIASSNAYSTTKHQQLRLKKLQDHNQQGEGEIPLYAHEQCLLNKGFNLPLPSNVQSSLCANENKDIKENSSSFISILNGFKGLAHALYKGTRYAVSHPSQVLVLGLAAHILPIGAQSNDFIINQIITNDQELPSVAGLTNGNVFVAWQDFRASTSNSDIYGRVLFPDGTALGNDFIINQITINDQEFPSVASLTNGNVFVAWHDNRAGSSDWDIYGRVLFPDGTALGNEFIIHPITTGQQKFPSVSGLTNGNVFVTWHDSSFDIYGRVFFPNGTALGNEFAISSSTYQQYPSVASLTNGNAFVAWVDGRSSTTYPDIYGRVFFPNGTALGSDFIINQITTYQQQYPSVSGLTNGNVFVAWQDHRDGGTSTSSDIYGRFLFSNGTAMGNEFIINQITTNYQQYPSVLALANGSTFVAWEDNRGGTSTNSDIYGRIFFSNGTAMGNEFIINQITTYYQRYPSVSGLTNGNVFIAWDDNRASTSNSDIYGLILSFSPFPNPLPAPAPIPSPVFVPAPNPLAVSGPFSVTPTPATVSLGSLPTSTSQTTLSSSNSQSTTGSTSSIFSTTTLTSSNLPSSTVQSSNPLEASDPSSGFSDDASWQTPAAIGGALGGTALIGCISALVAKKYCAKKKKSDTSIELVKENTYINPSETIETPASSQMISPFDATYKGFTEHPTFVGKIHGRTYDIWKTISQEEAELLRPLTSVTIPQLYSSQTINFFLGRGNFGATYAGSDPQTKEIYAIKEVARKKDVDASLKEGKIVHSLGDHPHIMPLVDYIHFKSSNEPRLLQVMPLAYVNGLGFKNLLEHSRLEYSSNNHRERIISDSFLQMMMGLDYIHKKGVVHLDIKADNTLYMKDGTLRIADFGKALEVGNNDQIDNIESLGDMRKFSPEIAAFIRKCKGETFDIVESFSGKGADVWAAGLYIWELLEDATDNLFSIKREISLAQKVGFTYDTFEKLVAPINALNGKYSPALINLLRQVLTVNPELRIKTFQAVRELSNSSMSDGERKAAFEELIRASTNSSAATDKQITVPVYAFADPDLYVKKSVDQQQPSAYLPSDFYTDDNQRQKAYLPSDFYAKEKL